MSSITRVKPVSFVPRALIFDLDGVLADLCEMHRDLYIESFNELARPPPGAPVGPLLSVEVHAQKLEGLSTRSKLKSCRDLFPGAMFDADAVYDLKQQRTLEVLATMSFPTRTRASFTWAKAAGLRLAVYTNSIRATLDVVLARLGIKELCDLTLSNEDVPASKPSSAGYTLAMEKLGLAASEVIIFEDSATGLVAAAGSGATVIPVFDSLDITPSFIEHSIHFRAPPAPKRVCLVVLFAAQAVAGYAFDKSPSGEPLWHSIVSNLLPRDPALLARVDVHAIVRSDARARFDAVPYPGAITIHEVGETAGPLISVLSIRSVINNEMPIIIANGRQLVLWDRGVDIFYRASFHPSYDGAVSTFYHPISTDLRWSYISLSSGGLITRIGEKVYIGPLATTGVYSWASGAAFVNYADAVLRDAKSVGDRFWVSQVYAQAIAEGMRFRNLGVEKYVSVEEAGPARDTIWKEVACGHE